MTRRLYLDLDGVLADFDAHFRYLFGADPVEFEAECVERFGSNSEENFWGSIQFHDREFYANLPYMQDALHLYNAVRELRPVILTGTPFDYYPGAVRQKETWVRERISSSQIVICCDASRKWEHCRPGDILVDDRPKHADKWRKAGGVWITHTSAEDSLQQLAEHLSSAGLKIPW